MSPNVPNPTKKGLKAYGYPEFQVMKILDLVKQILILIQELAVDQVVIEEINRGISRLTQKTLDGLHYVLLVLMPIELVKTVVFIDSDGSNGWRSRSGLGLQLSEYDKEQNKERKRRNKKLPRSEQLPIINQKHLSCRYTNKMLGTSFDVDKRKFDADVCDAINLGWHFLNRL